MKTSIASTFLAPATTMETFQPDFEIIKMDAEVASYQEDFEPDGERRDDARAELAESRNETPTA